MIIAENENLQAAIDAVEYTEKGGKICCGHDFHDKEVDFGDIVYCGRCHQYFTKVKSMAWLVRGGKSRAHADMDIDCTFPPHSNHLEDCVCWVKVPVRVTNRNE